MDTNVKIIIGITVILIAGLASAMIPLSRVLGKIICSFKKDSKFQDPEYSKKVGNILRYSSYAVMAIGILILFLLSRS